MKDWRWFVTGRCKKSHYNGNNETLCSLWQHHDTPLKTGNSFLIYKCNRDTPLHPEKAAYFLNTFDGFKWVYLNNCRTSLCPDISATSGTDIPISKNLETASCLKSWNRKSVMPALLRALFHARRKQVAEMGNNCSLVWGTIWRTSMHLLVRGTRLSSPFLVS